MTTTELSGRVRDRRGERFGRLVVVEYAGLNVQDRATWKCRCDCGNETVVWASNLRTGHTKSCGCLAADKVAERNETHGMSDTPEYGVWWGMKRRCEDPDRATWESYGGRGISVCERWRQSFEAFYEDMGPRPSPDHTIDRIDNDGDYTPENCRWLPKSEQSKNYRNNRHITFRGEAHHLAEWARRTGIKAATIRARLDKHGWSVARALTEKPRMGRRPDGFVPQIQ